MLEKISGDYLVQPPFSKQGKLEQVTQGHVQLVFEYLQGWGESTTALDTLF